MANEGNRDFYEDDEPAEAVRAAFRTGQKVVTTRPAYISSKGPVFTESSNAVGVGATVQNLKYTDFAGVRTA